MSEKNSHNDPFDDIFRRKEDPVDIPFREEDWLKLEKKLDAYDAKIVYRRRLGYLLAAAILLISMMGYLTSDIRLQTYQADGLADEQITSNDGLMDAEEQSDSGALENNDDRFGAEYGESNQVSEAPSVPDDYASNRGETSFLNAASSDSGGTDRSAYATTIERADFLIAMDCRECNSVDPSGSYSLELSVNYERVKLSNLKTEKTENILAASYDDRENPFGELHSARLSRFSIGVKAAPDLSTVGGLTNFQSPGYSFGFDIAYRINDRFSVSTGIARSVVRYKADEGGYDTPVYLNGGLVPDQMTGECVLLDIPLGLRVNLLRFSGSRVFATGSLSSYIMLNEAYQFDSEYSYGDTPGYNYDENTGTSHFMSNAGLSIGYEYDLNSNFSIRFEPQIKIPIREVGVTNVRLFSLGSFFSLSYNL